jgi:hypothetical protein
MRRESALTSQRSGKTARVNFHGLGKGAEHAKSGYPHRFRNHNKLPWILSDNPNPVNREPNVTHVETAASAVRLGRCSRGEAQFLGSENQSESRPKHPRPRQQQQSAEDTPQPQHRHPRAEMRPEKPARDGSDQQPAHQSEVHVPQTKMQQ